MRTSSGVGPAGRKVCRSRSSCTSASTALQCSQFISSRHCGQSPFTIRTVRSSCSQNMQAKYRSTTTPSPSSSSVSTIGSGGILDSNRDRIRAAALWTGRGSPAVRLWVSSATPTPRSSHCSASGASSSHSAADSTSCGSASFSRRWVREK